LTIIPSTQRRTAGQSSGGGGTLASASSLLAVGAVAVALLSLETALIPGALIGAAAMLAPRQLARLRGRRDSRVSSPKGDASQSASDANRGIASRLKVGRSAAKAVTFRIISSSADFGWNYILLGEIAPAVGLSAFSLAAAPVFYFLHETVWNRLGAENASAKPNFNKRGDEPHISRTFAKTITYRTFATLSEFGTNYLFVRDVGLAAQLSAFSFVAGPFIYVAHEKAWERHESGKSDDLQQRGRELRNAVTSS
jgi:uncharacterized membrane protein